MKLQGLSIIFALIIIPMLLVLTYYIQLQVETIELQTSYDAKLLDATHDAMVAFELNTANEDLSSVADSLRSIIDASSNIFMNTLATNMGLSNASKSYLQPFIPAVLYTLYDGYYINSPTNVPVIAVDSTGVAIEIGADENKKITVPGLRYNGTEYLYDSLDIERNDASGIPAEDFGQLLYKKNNGNYTTNINDEDILYSKEFVLKSYMPYSARYIHDDIDVLINYTLDNYLTIVYKNDTKKINYTKSGYLIKSDLVSSVKINETPGSTILLENISSTKKFNYNENDAETKIKEALQSGNEVRLILNVEDTTEDPPQNKEIVISTTDINSDEASAIIYYTKAAIFSNWVYSNLNDIRESDIIENMSEEIIGTIIKKEDEKVIYSFEEKNNIIFDENQDPEENNSIFINHKYQVIRNSIQYNLNLAMSTYNNETKEEYSFNMPVIDYAEWEKIIENVSIVSFMQGLNCGLKTYNNYKIVSSTNNELTVIPHEIYFVNKKIFDNANKKDEDYDKTIEIPNYHRIDCPELLKEINQITIESDKKLTSFKSKEVKYDKYYEKADNEYKYDHKSLACYTCIVDGNYSSEVLDDDRQKAYYIALGKERNNIYKMNSIKYSEGYEIHSDLSNSKSIDLKDVKQIKLTFGEIPVNDFNETTVTIEFQNTNFKDSISNSKSFVLTTNQSKEQTIIIPIDCIIDNTNFNISEIKNIEIVSEKSTVDVEKIKEAMKSLKIIYK